jgi:hypothetical protein
MGQSEAVDLEYVVGGTTAADGGAGRDCAGLLMRHVRLKTSLSEQRQQHAGSTGLATKTPGHMANKQSPDQTDCGMRLAEMTASGPIY